VADKCEHIELSTDAPEKAVAFYSKVFGWMVKGTRMPDGSVYHMFDNGNGGGGITAKANKAQPTAWTPYITVKSVKATQKAAAALGARPIPGYEYVSMGPMGAVGGFTDPTGAAIYLYEAGPPAPKKAKAGSKKAKAAAKTAAPKKAKADSKKAKTGSKKAKAAAKAAAPEKTKADSKKTQAGSKKAKAGSKKAAKKSRR
jgi:hypothetical protein